MNARFSRTKNPFMARLNLLFMAVAALGFSTSVLSGCTTARQMLFHEIVSQKIFKAYLDMPASAEVDESSVRAAILNALPVGVNEEQVYGFLDHHRVSRSPSDAVKFYLRKNQQNEIICSLSYNPDPSLRATYLIKFLISDRKTLKDVSVTKSQVFL